MKKLLSVLLGVAMLLALVPASVFAEGYAVKIGEQGYATLSEAITQAEEGAQIILQKDITLTENITISKDVNISGAYAITFYDNQTAENYRVTIADGVKVSFDGVTLQGTYGADVAAPFLTLRGTAQLSVKNGAILDNSTGFSSAYGLINTMAATAGSKVTIDNCTITSKKGASGPTYYVLGGGGTCQFVVKDCQLNLGSWLLFNAAASGTISNCVFHSGVVVNSMSLQGLTFSGNTFKEAMYGTRFVIAGDYTIENNVFENLKNDLAIGIYAGPSGAGKAVISGNTFTMTEGSYGIRLNVASWAAGGAGGNAADLTIRNNKFLGSDCMYQIRNNDGWTGTVDVSYNYFGGGAAKTTYGQASVSVGSIHAEPYFVAETMRNPQDLNNYVCPHTETELRGRVEATYTSAGYSGDEVCKECGEIVKAGHILPILVQVEDNTAVVPETTVDKAIDEAVAEAPAGEKVEVILPLQPELKEEDVQIQEVQLPTAALEKVAQKADALTIVMSEAQVTLDKKALATVVTLAGNEATVTLDVKRIATEALAQEQKSAVEKLEAGDREVVSILSTAMLVDGQAVADEATGGFRGGKVTVRVPFVPAQGTRGQDYTVVYLADDGSTKVMKTTYEDGYLVFELEHFSDYAIMRESNSSPDTGDSGVLLWVVALFASAACAVIWSKKRAV